MDWLKELAIGRTFGMARSIYDKYGEKLLLEAKRLGYEVYSFRRGYVGFRLIKK